MTAFATHERVEAMWRPLSDAEIVVATSKLDQASRIIRHRFPTIDTRIAAGDVDADLVGDVAADMVIRYLRNPDGLERESIQDYSYQRDSAKTGVLFLTSAEIELLTPATQTSLAFNVPYANQPTGNYAEPVYLNERHVW